MERLGFCAGKLNVYGALMFIGDKWKSYPWDWWNVSYDNDGHFHIYGGVFPDPDEYYQFRRTAP
jgi:hypothetical protein